MCTFNQFEERKEDERQEQELKTWEDVEKRMPRLLPELEPTTEPEPTA